MEKRETYVRIWKDLSSDKNMILLVGPRQVGKTTLAQIISKSFKNYIYFNWDIPEHRKDFLENPTFFEMVERKDPSKPLVVLDEIHKYKDCKNYLKGVYDKFNEDYLFLVPGSRELDFFQKEGDSLAGRYSVFHLWPFTISERGRRSRDIEEFLRNPLFFTMENAEEHKKMWIELSERSGFPEPFLSGRIRTYRRWSNIYSQQLIREDVRDLAGVKSVVDMETLYLLLPSKVGSPISVPSLARDLKVSYNSVRKWLGAFERFFLIFSIGPWTNKIARAIQKERKVYIWDMPQIKDPGARFENMVAQELWRAVTIWNDLGFGAFSLHFIKNKEQQEVDFLIANEGEPFLLIEAKLSDTQPSKPLKKFQNVLNIPAVQLVGESEGYRMLPNGSQFILVVSGYQWLSLLP